MRRFILPILFTAILSSCNGWIIQPLPGPTPFLPSTPTPSIFTPTPVVISVTSTSATPALFATKTNTPISTDTETPSPVATLTSLPIGPSIMITVLGCNTSIDITHGMGEVTNAFVTLKNAGSVELTNLKVTLFALDEGRVHPNKTFELVSLPIGYQVTIKLTVDSTYKKETPIQVEVTSDQGTFPLEGSQSCTDIGILAPRPEGLNTPVPAP